MVSTGNSPLTAVAALLEASHRLHPDHIAGAVSALAPRLGVRAVDVFLVDYDQRLLLSLVGDCDPLDIDGTLAGRAYQLQRVLADAPTGEPDADVRIWVPLVDGADRFGVLGVTAVDSGELRLLLRVFAAVVADLIHGKSELGDGIERVRRTRQMDLAAELRWTMLPPLTFATDRVAIAGILEPAYEIAGDCFDYALNGDVAHLAILDAVGHGLEASRIANLAVTAYRNARRGARGLRATFEEVDKVVFDQFGHEKFVTGQIAELRMSTGHLDMLNAGHPRPILLRNGTNIAEVQCEALLPLGLGDVPAEELRVALEPGDRLLFFSDGVIEATSATGELFGRDRLADLLVKAAASQLPAAEVVRRLCHAVLAHEAGHLRDDATLLLVEWHGDAGLPAP